MTADTYLYVQTVANRMKCSDKTVYRLIQEGKLRAVRIGGRSLRIPESAFDEYLSAQVVDPDADLQA
jgi:excisionase family DNA binding protein